jgi:RNA polymerase sigma-70 factor, ECF subfamily
MIGNLGWSGGVLGGLERSERRVNTVVAVLEVAVSQGDGSAARRALADVDRADADDRDQALDLLARRAAEGSPLAVELLIETVDRWDVARSVVRGVLLDESAVDDVTQDTLITVAQAIRSFRGDAKFTTWLHRLARNRVVDYLRRARSTEPLDDHEPAGAAAHMSSLIASRHAVRQLLDELPETYRTAVVLRDVEHLPYAEVATRLGRNLNTVKSHVARGRALLAGLVERHPVE